MGASGILRELAHAELENKSYTTAQRHLKTLLKIDPNPVMRQSYLHQLRRLKQSKKLHFGLSFAIAPSSNINQGTYEDLLDTVIGDLVVDEDSKARSGVGLSLGLNSQLRLAQNGQSRLGLKAALGVTRYPAFNDLNQNSTDLSLLYQRSTRSGLLAFEPYWQVTRQQDNSDRQVAGLAFTLNHRLAPNWTYQIVLKAEERRYRGNPRKNGTAGSLQGRLRYAWRPKLHVEGVLTLQRVNAEADHLAHWGRRGEIKLTRAFETGHLGSLSVFAGQHQFDGDFPLTTTARADRTWGLSLQLTFPSIGATALQPQLGCVLSRGRSNIALYNSNTQSCALSFQRAF